MKGLSPVIAGILLVAVTIAVTTIVMNWASSYSKEKVSAADRMSDTVDCSGLFLEVNEMNFDGSKITLSVKNTGSDTVNSTKQMILWDNNSYTETNVAINLDVGDIGTYTIQDTDVVSGINVSDMSGHEMTKLEVVPKGCESSPIPLRG